MLTADDLTSSDSTLTVVKILNLGVGLGMTYPFLPLEYWQRNNLVLLLRRMTLFLRLFTII